MLFSIAALAALAGCDADAEFAAAERAEEAALQLEEEDLRPDDGQVPGTFEVGAGPGGDGDTELAPFDHSPWINDDMLGLDTPSAGEEQEEEEKPTFCHHCVETAVACNMGCQIGQNQCDADCQGLEGDAGQACLVECNAAAEACDLGCSTAETACDEVCVVDVCHGCVEDEDACQLGCALTHQECAAPCFDFEGDAQDTCLAACESIRATCSGSCGDDLVACQNVNC